MLRQQIVSEFLQFATKAFERSLKLPWKICFFATFCGFCTATILSVVVAKVFLINASSTQQKPLPNSDQILERERPSLMKTEVDLILSRNIFNIDGEYPDEEDQKKEEDSKEPANQEAVKTTLPLKLSGTIYGGDPYSGLAVIQDTEKKSYNSFMVGNTLGEGVVLVEIYKEKIILTRNGRREFLEMDIPVIQTGRKNKQKKSKKAPASDKPKYVVEAPPDSYKEEGFERQGTEITFSKDFRSKLLTTDFTKILQDAKAEPYLENGELLGFRLTRVRTDSIYEKSGIRNDDIVREINGVSLSSAAQAVKLLNSLREESEIEVRLIRDGKPITVNIRVK